MLMVFLILLLWVLLQALNPFLFILTISLIFKSLKKPPIYTHIFYNLSKCFTNFTPPKHFCYVKFFYFSALVYTFYFVCLLFFMVSRASAFRYI